MVKTLLKQWLQTVMALSILLIAGGGSAIADEIFTFDLIPADGNVNGAAGSTVGWGYSITNQSSTDWLVTTNLVSDSFSNATLNLLFDFPEIAPGTTVTESFDALNNVGLYDLVWDATAPGGFVNSGNFTLSAQWFDGDILSGGNYIVDAPDTNAAYSASVTAGAATPEPHTFFLGIIAIGVVVLMNNRLPIRRRFFRR